jgi:hypothetical protein
MTNEIKCPKCGSNQITANKKGFSGKKAVAGAVLTGGIGLLAGTLGSNKVMITCLNCGNQFRPGQHLEQPKKTNTFKLPPLPPPTKEKLIALKTRLIVMIVICLIIAIICAIVSSWTIFSISLILIGIFSLVMNNAKNGIREFENNLK